MIALDTKPKYVVRPEVIVHRTVTCEVGPPGVMEATMAEMEARWGPYPTAWPEPVDCIDGVLPPCKRWDDELKL